MLAAGSLTGAMAQTFSTAPNIYVYNFNDGATPTGGNSAANTTALFTVDKSPTGSATGSALTSSFVATNITDFGGTTVNADPGDVAGDDLGLQGGGATGAIANNGGYLQATADFTGYTATTFSYATRGSSTGFKTEQFQYSLDGTTFTNLGTAVVPTTTYTAYSYSLTGLGLDNDAAAAFRIVFDGATSATGNSRIDNLIIAGTAAAVPEASTTISLGLLLALGLGGFAVTARRRNPATAAAL